MDGSYRDTVIERIIFMCNQKNYSFVTDFEWYTQILVDLTHFEGASVENAARIVSQLLDVAVRVDGVREYTVQCMSALIREQRVKDPSNPMNYVFLAAAWILGEYAEFITDYPGVISSLLSSEVSSLAPDVQGVVIHASFKVFVALCFKEYSSGKGVFCCA